MTEKLIDPPRRLLAGALLALVVGAFVTAAMATDGPPRPRSASAPETQFSAERAMRHLEAFAAEPRPLGSPAAARTRDYLAGRLRAEGFDVRVHRAVGARSASGLATFGRVDNVVATLRGTASTGTVLLAAHYDSAAMGPGASDDGAAVAAALETARALRAAGPLRNDVVVLLTDGEEDGVLGAEAFVREHPALRDGLVLNFEARGVGGPSLMFETSRGNAGLVRAFAHAAPRPHGDSSMVEVYRALPNNTDFTPLSKAGYRGMNFAYIQDGSHYHTATDSIANLDRGSLQHHGGTMLALARELGNADIPELDTGGDATYFRLPGLMVVYPGALSGVLAALSVAALGGLVAAARARRLLSLPRTALAAVSAVVPLVLAIVLAEAVWFALAGARPAYDAMGGLVHRPVPYRCAVAAITGFALLLWYLPLRRRLGPAALAAGALAWPAGLGVLLAATAPGAAFLCTLPALGAALGGLGAVLLPRGGAVALGAGAAVPALLLPAWAQAVFDGMGLALAGIPALAIALFGLTVLPVAELLLPAPRLRTTLVVPAAALATAVALVVAGLAFDTFDRTHPRRTHLAYVRDAGASSAHWVSGDADPPPWTRKLAPVRDGKGLPPGYARGPLWTGPAPLVNAAAPELSVLGRSGDAYRLRVAAGRGARSVTLRFENPITEATATVPRAGSAQTAVTGTRRRTWPGEVRFRGLPATGAVITVRVPKGGRVTAIAETPGLSALRGTPRPDDVIPSTREDGDITAVTRTYRLDEAPDRGA